MMVSLYGRYIIYIVIQFITLLPGIITKYIWSSYSAIYYHQSLPGLKDDYVLKIFWPLLGTLFQALKNIEDDI